MTDSGQIAGTTDFLVDEWLIEPLRRRISLGERAEKLEPKAIQVLVCLARRPGEVVTREQLLEEAWPDVVVGEEALNNAIAKLRKVFGDQARQPRYIETVPKIGYRLIARVSLPKRDLPTVTVPTSRPRRLIGWLPYLLIALVLFVMLAMIIPFLSETETQPELIIGSPRPLIELPHYKSNPAVHPDGTLVFSWPGEAEDNWDIYRLAPGATVPERLTEHPAFEDSPSFLPDGGLVYQRIDRDRNERAVFRIGPDRVPEKLVDCGHTVYADLAASADGRLLAFNGRQADGEAFGIMLVELETSIRRRLTDPEPVLWGDHDPAFSPDGRQIAFVRSASEGVQDLYLIEARGGEARRITFDARNIVGVTWDAVGEQLIFASNRGGILSLWRVAVDSGSPEPLSPLAWSAAKPFLPAGGNQLVYLRTRTVTDLSRVDLDTGRGSYTRTHEPSWNLHPAFSPDGSALAFTSDREGSFEVWLREETTEKKLTEFGGPFTGTARFSPDGGALVFDSRPAGHADIYLIERNGGPPRRLTHHPSDDLAPSFSRDGKSVLFASARSGRWQIWQRDLEDGQLEQVTTEGGFGAMEGVDGKLYLTRFNEDGLWRMDEAGTHRLLDEPAADDWCNWQTTATGIVWLSRREGEDRIWHLDLGSGERQLLYTAPNPVPKRDVALALSPDGQTLILAQVHGEGNQIMAIDLH